MMASFVLQSSVLKDLSDRNNSLNARSGLRQSLHAEVVGVSIGFGHVGHVASSSAGRSNVMTDVPPKVSPFPFLTLSRQRIKADDILYRK